MKKILCAAVVVAILFSACKKQPTGPVIPPIHLPLQPVYMTNVEGWLKTHLTADDYSTINFSQYHTSKDSSHWYIRLAFKNKPISSDFLLLQTDTLANPSIGRFIHYETKIDARHQVNGSIELSSLDKKTIVVSPITNGYVEAWHPALFAKDRVLKRVGTRESSFPVPIDYDELPEVVVVAYLVPANGGDSFGLYMAWSTFFQSGGGGGGGGSTGGGDNSSYNGDYQNYGYASGYYPNGYGYTGADNNPSSTEYMAPADVPDIAVEIEKSSMRPQIDMNAWMKCFTDIPDAGATCSVTLLGDLPVDSDPNLGMNLWSGNTGHCFLQLTKTNAGQSVTQIIGFTAESPGAAIVNTEAFVPGKTVDNAGHKYDCSITMDLTTYGFNTVIDKMKALSSSMPYSVVNYDCLDYGLEVFNSVRPDDPLRISKTYSVSDPFSNIANGPKLFTLLENMVASGSPEAGNITIGGPRHAGVSHGPCN